MVTVVTSFLYQLLNDGLLYNLDDCSFYLFEVFDYLYDAVLLFTKSADVWGASKAIVTAFHIGPVAYKKCSILYNDYTGAIDAYNNVIWASWTDTLINSAELIGLNAVDIYYELLTLGIAYQFGDYSTVGAYAGKITSDLFLKSPLMENWSYHNSESVGQNMYYDNYD